MQTYIHNLIDLELLNGKGKALDLGCGNGIDTQEFLKLGYEVVGVDNKPNPYITESKTVDNFLVAFFCCAV